MIPECVAVFGVSPALWVGVELVVIGAVGAARLHLFFPGSGEPFAEYRYLHAIDALRACCALLVSGDEEPGGPWYERRIGPWVEHRCGVLRD